MSTVIEQRGASPVAEARSRTANAAVRGLALVTGGAFLVVAPLVFGVGVAAWCGLGIGVAAAALALLHIPSLHTPAAQRPTDVLTLLVGALTAVAARTLTGDDVRWTVLGGGAALIVCGLATVSLPLLSSRPRSSRYDHLDQSVPTGIAAQQMGNPTLDGWAFRGPLAGSYWSAALLVVFALVPYLVLATTVGAIASQIGADVGLGKQAMALTNGMSNAAYAVGTVIALQLNVHLRGRRLLVSYALTFVLGSVLAAWAPTSGLFIAGRILQGGMTGLMLIAAVPPLVIGWPASRLNTTAIVLNMGIFGAVAAGPLLGGFIAGQGGDWWRILFWVVTGLGGGAFLLSVLTFFDQPPFDKRSPWSPGAVLLAGMGCALTFFGSSELTSHRFVSTWVMLPLLAGLLTIFTLVLQQFRAKNPLMPVKRLTSTFPVVGIMVAICAGAASIGVTELVQNALLAKGESPSHVGTLFWPYFGGAIVAALLFGILFKTKWVKLIALSGLICIAGASAIMSGVATGGDALVWTGTGLLGFGVGASVAPALFIAGFSLPSNNVARIFALIELLRAVAAFSVAPILAHVATTTGSSPAVGTRTAVWVCMAIAAGAASVAVYLFVLARAKPHHPKIERWIGGTEPAFDSPALAAAVRGLTSDPEHDSDYPGHEEPAPRVPTLTRAA